MADKVMDGGGGVCCVAYDNPETSMGHLDKMRFASEMATLQDELLGGYMTPSEFGRLCEEAAVKWRGW